MGFKWNITQPIKLEFIISLTQSQVNHYTCA